MPITVKELVIRATVSPSTKKGEGKGKQSDTANEAIIQQCVERVLEKLEKTKER